MCDAQTTALHKQATPDSLYGPRLYHGAVQDLARKIDQHRAGTQEEREPQPERVAIDRLILRLRSGHRCFRWDNCPSPHAALRKDMGEP